MLFYYALHILSIEHRVKDYRSLLNALQYYILLLHSREAAVTVLRAVVFQFKRVGHELNEFWRSRPLLQHNRQIFHSTIDVN